MLFNSAIFIFIFLPVTFIVYFTLLKKRLLLGAKAFLVLSSLFFYSYWNIKYLPLILISMIVNYSVGNSLGKDIKGIRVSKKSILIFGIVFNLGLLGYFKYMDFFIKNINFIFSSNFNLLHIALPLAISFFTFQQIAYLVDSYKGQTSEYDFLNYALFVTFFPQLIAGPIVHHKEMMDQFSNIRTKVINYKNIASGLFIFSIGLFKKVVIADTFATFANIGFDKAHFLNFFDAWATSLSYTFQLYFDFSGYTDMAIGIGLMFNILLPINFNSPYKALSIQDFWRRWHITLSRFLRDYLYIPLGGNRVGNIRVYFNLFITFLLGGLWHGAGWTFVIWGASHGVALCIHRLWNKLGFRLNKILAWFITFNFINLTWVFFRAKNIHQAFDVILNMFDVSKIYISQKYAEKLSSFIDLHSFVNIEYFFNFKIKVLGFIILIFLFISFKSSNDLLLKFKINKMYLFFVIAVLGFSLIYMLYSQNRISQFIYFNF